MPGAADRIITRFESQGQHRQDLERDVVRKGNRNELVGTIGGILVALAALGVSAYALHEDQPIAAVTTLIATISGLVLAVRGGRRATASDMVTKREFVRAHKNVAQGRKDQRTAT